MRYFDRVSRVATRSDSVLFYMGLVRYERFDVFRYDNSCENKPHAGVRVRCTLDRVAM